MFLFSISSNFFLRRWRWWARTRWWRETVATRAWRCAWRGLRAIVSPFIIFLRISFLLHP
jgi:hypothetical protein